MLPTRSLIGGAAFLAASLWALTWPSALQARTAESHQQTAHSQLFTSPHSRSTRKRIVQFPPNYSMGTLGITHRVYNPELHIVTDPLGPAQGKVALPEESCVTLHLGNLGYRHPEELAKLPVDALYGLKITLISLGDAEDGLCDRVLTFAGSLSGLKVLDVSSSDVTDAGLVHAAKLKDLETVSAADTAVSGSCLRSLSHLTHLRELNLRNDRLIPDSLSCLPKTESLTCLILEHTNMSNASLAHVGSCQNIEVLYISRNPDVTDEGLRPLANLHHLVKLALDETNVSIKGLAVLKDLPLRDLTLPSTRYTGAEMAAIRRLFPHTYCHVLKETKDEDAYVIMAPMH